MEEAQNHSRELADLMRRLTRLERKKARPVEVTEADFTDTRSKTHYFDSHITLVDEQITADKSWTESGASAYIPSTATEAILWCGIDDTTQGVGTSLLEARIGDKVLTIGEIREPGSGDAIVTLGQCRIPVVGGGFDYRVTLAGGATALDYKIELVGYVI